MNSAPVSEIDPLSILNYGEKAYPLGMPKTKPTSSKFGGLYAVITSGTSQKVKEVTEPADYAELYAQATANGCPFTVTLYFADPRKLIHL